MSPKVSKNKQFEAAQSPSKDTLDKRTIVDTDGIALPIGKLNEKGDVVNTDGKIISPTSVATDNSQHFDTNKPSMPEKDPNDFRTVIETEVVALPTGQLNDKGEVENGRRGSILL